MDVIFVFNGLGNQMSQYALYLQKKALGQHVKCVFKNTAHNGIELNHLFGIKVQNSSMTPLYTFLAIFFSYTKYKRFMNIAKKVLNMFKIKGTIERSNYSFNPEVLSKHTGLNIIHGGWHHYKYFADIEDVVRKTYIFPPFFDERNIEVAEKGRDEKHIAVHIRRGDYVKSAKFGPVCDENYYYKAFEYFEKIIKDPVFYVFSNDIEWSRSLLKNKHAVFVDWNKKENSWADMALMSKFKNIIIANSTYSWWAAWLGNNVNVICPPFLVANDYGSDIFDPNWIRISKEGF